MSVFSVFLAAGSAVRWSLVITYYIIDVIILLLLAHSIVSWIPSMREGSVGELLEKLCGPILAPMRALTKKLGLTRGLPIDFSPLFTMVVLVIIQGVISSFI
ncbi:MAG: YggT family protein [Clostridia bacterium]|nr:YggT family protein [Clostridia bacterium]